MKDDPRFVKLGHRVSGRPLLKKWLLDHQKDFLPLMQELSLLLLDEGVPDFSFFTDEHKSEWVFFRDGCPLERRDEK